LILHLFSKLYLRSQGGARQGTKAAVNAMNDAGDVVPPNLRGATSVDALLREGEDETCTLRGGDCETTNECCGAGRCCDGRCLAGGSGVCEVVSPVGKDGE